MFVDFFPIFSPFHFALFNSIKIGRPFAIIYEYLKESDDDDITDRQDI